MLDDIFVPVYRTFVKNDGNVGEKVDELAKEDTRIKALFGEEMDNTSMVMIPEGMPGAYRKLHQFTQELPDGRFEPYVSLTHSVRSTLMNLAAQVVAHNYGPDAIIGFFNPAATKSRLTEEVAKQVLEAFETDGIDEVGVWSADNPAHAFVACGFAEASCHFIRARAVLEVPYSHIADDPAPGMPEWEVKNLDTGDSFRLHGAEDSQRCPSPGAYAFVKTDGSVYSDLKGFGGDPRIQNFKLVRAFLNHWFEQRGYGIRPELLWEHEELEKTFASWVARHLNGVRRGWRTPDIDDLASRFRLPRFEIRQANT